MSKVLKPIATPPTEINKEKGCNNAVLGSKKNEPMIIGDILNNMLQSNEPLALNYRKFMATKVSAEKGDIENG